MKSKYSLNPIRIPSGWFVYINRLYNVNIDNIEFIKNHDLHIKFLDTGMLALRNTHAELVAYIDWLPAGDINGQYHLKFFQENVNHEELFHYKTRSLSEIVLVLEDKLLNPHTLNKTL